MSEEIEAKVRVDDPEAVRGRLHRWRGTGYGPVLETNRLFDDARRTLSAAGAALRLRQERPASLAEGSGRAGPSTGSGQAGSVLRTLLTYKGPRTESRMKRRPEFETLVGAAEPMIAILAGLGLAEIFRFEKRRTSWHVGLCEVVLDELPHLGWFVEVEGPDEEEVLRCLLGGGPCGPAAHPRHLHRPSGRRSCRPRRRPHPRGLCVGCVLRTHAVIASRGLR